MWSSFSLDTLGVREIADYADAERRGHEGQPSFGRKKHGTPRDGVSRVAIVCVPPTWRAPGSRFARSGSGIRARSRTSGVRCLRNGVRRRTPVVRCLMNGVRLRTPVVRCLMNGVRRRTPVVRRLMNGVRLRTPVVRRLMKFPDPKGREVCAGVIFRAHTLLGVGRKAFLGGPPSFSLGGGRFFFQRLVFSMKEATSAVIGTTR